MTSLFYLSSLDKGQPYVGIRVMTTAYLKLQWYSRDQTCYLSVHDCVCSLSYFNTADETQMIKWEA